MALIEGTTCGFVTTSPTNDPEGSGSLTIDNYALVSKYTSPATAIKIIEIGWWCNTASEEANFEVGLYAADGEVVPGEAGTLLEVSRTNAKGTTAGWKKVTGLNWTIAPNTAYWIGVQLDDTATTTYIDRETEGFSGRDAKSAQTTLPNPFGGGSLSDADATYAMYAVYETAPPTGTNIQINIGDVFKDVSEIKINIGGTWKAVIKIQINIGDAWKTVFEL